MRKLLAVVVLAIQPLTFSATQGTITISGVVDPIEQITVTSQTGFNALDLASGETDKLIAIVRERSNSRDGYKVVLRSSNANAAGSSQAFLKGADPANLDVINYSIKYNNTSVTLDAQGEAEVTSSASRTTGLGVDKDVHITFAASSVNTDTYSDTITFTIINN